MARPGTSRRDRAARQKGNTMTNRVTTPADLIDQLIRDKAQLAVGDPSEALSNGYEQELEAEIGAVLGSDISRAAALWYLVSSRIFSLALDAMPYPSVADPGDNAIGEVVEKMTGVLCKAIADQGPGTAPVSAGQTALTNLTRTAIIAQAKALREFSQ
jgi:hypothetical protein